MQKEHINKRICEKCSGAYATGKHYGDFWTKVSQPGLETKGLCEFCNPTSKWHKKKDFCCRWSPTLGALEDTHENIWGTKTYNPETDIEKPCVFFGIYGFPDFYALWRHKGKRYVLWAGSDIIHFLNGYWLDPEGKIRINRHQLAPWIDTYCENYVENEVEQIALRGVGIRSKIIPSFLGKVEDYPVSYEWSDKPKLYTSISGDNFKLYGWPKVVELAFHNPQIEFHFYGNEAHYDAYPLHNVKFHGRVPKEQMNEETRKMQGALRLTEFDGFSEILAKSILWGQWPVSLIEYPHMLKVEDIAKIHEKKEPNIEGREHYRKIINKYPWNENY